MEMFVCVCLAVSETEVREAIACGAKTRESVTRACRAGGDCGACHSMINAMIEDAIGPLSAQAIPVVAPALAACPPPAESEQQLVAAELLLRKTHAA
jgi:bacterioferritin-associated ferredoxin